MPEIMKLLWFLLGAAVMVQARPDGEAGGWASEPKFVVTEDGIKPNSNVVEQDAASHYPPSGWSELTEREQARQVVKAASAILSSTAGPKSSTINTDVTKPITAESLINFHQVQDPAPKPEPTCIDNWHYCRRSNKPCCGQQLKEDGTLGPKHFICFELGQGICTPLDHIDNLDLYVKLVNQLNDTNFSELDNQYWNSVSYPKSSSNY